MLSKVRPQGLRGQFGSAELDAGAYIERHSHATSDNFGVDALTQYDELSYVVFPWLVPAASYEPLPSYSPPLAAMLLWISLPVSVITIRL